MKFKKSGFVTAKFFLEQNLTEDTTNCTQVVVETLQDGALKVKGLGTNGEFDFKFNKKSKFSTGEFGEVQVISPENSKEPYYFWTKDAELLFQQAIAKQQSQEKKCALCGHTTKRKI